MSLPSIPQPLKINITVSTPADLMPLEIKMPKKKQVKVPLITVTLPIITADVIEQPVQGF